MADDGTRPVPPVVLVRICDLAGRPRGTGFVADDLGTVVTSHETVDGLSRLVLHAPGDRTCLAEADAITPLPEHGLALVRTEGLDVRPLPVTGRTEIAVGTYVRLAAGGWREARVLGAAPVTYTATDRFHLLDSAMELAMGTAGSDALRLGGAAAGGPVLDAETGAVLAVLGTSLTSAHRAAGYAVPLTTRADGPLTGGADGPLGELLRRNAASVPAYGQDLNLAGALQLTATSVGSVGGPGLWQEPVEREWLVREFADFEAGGAAVLGLVGAPGTGRTTELAALAARRARGAGPAPTVWLRGADLRDKDASVAAAVGRALAQAGRIVAASGAPGDMGVATPERVARLARDAGRPLLVLLDGPEEMPPVLAHRLAEWTAGTALWLRECGARLVIACRPEHWEQAGALYPPEALHQVMADRLPPAVLVGDLAEAEAGRARERYGIEAGALGEPDARHPLTLRLLAEVRAALPGGTAPGCPTREEVFEAYLGLACLRVAVRVAAARRPALRGSAVRRLAAEVSGRLHEAARRCLGPGQGELGRAAFEEIFPWRTGWASAVLTEGVLVPAGGGYRFAHEEVADWVQGAHLDLGEAVQGLVHRGTAEVLGVVSGATSPRTPPVVGGVWPGAVRVPAQGRRTGGVRDGDPGGEGDARVLPVPRHRIGPVVEAMLLLERNVGTAELAVCLRELIASLEVMEGEESADAQWWGAQLLAETLLRVPDVGPYSAVLKELAEAVTARSLRAGGPRGLGGLGRFGPWFWERIAVDQAERVDLLRVLVLADGVPDHQASSQPDHQASPRPDHQASPRPDHQASPQPDQQASPRPEHQDQAPPEALPPAPRYLDALVRLLVVDVRRVQVLLCGWFGDGRVLPGGAGLTVAEVAQVVLHTHRGLAVDDLVETLVEAGHERADELLHVLAVDESAALCRAVDRWAHDGRAERRVAAASYGGVVAPHAAGAADRELLRFAALALLARGEDLSLHGAALALLVRDPASRSRFLPRAVAAFVVGEPRVPADALVAALSTHPEPVLAALRTGLHAADSRAGEVLAALAGVNTPALARRAAALVAEYLARCPDGAGHVAAYVDARLESGPGARAVLFPLVSGALRGSPWQVRSVLAPVLAAPGSTVSRALRAELLDVLLEYEEFEEYVRECPGREGREPAVLDAVLVAAARGARVRDEEWTRELVRRAGTLLVRTPDGATRFDRRLVALAREVPGFARLVAGWLAAAPQQWAALVGPSSRRTVQTLAEASPPHQGHEGGDGGTDAGCRAWAWQS
ncbi:trypsin-like peptidase domain-containing protein [Streptomyces sp. NPDC021093]|uniref:trypsin-like peptidase domain-containing protein n=1 Tax=Streptomyces sp. NPDC021093 TaxID=3365112 RepID=UPI0037A89C5E